MNSMKSERFGGVYWKLLRKITTVYTSVFLSYETLTSLSHFVKIRLSNFLDNEFLEKMYKL